MRRLPWLLVAVTWGCGPISLPPGRLCSTAHLEREADTDCDCFVLVRAGDKMEWRRRQCPPPSPSPQPTATPSPSPSPSPAPTPTPTPLPTPTPPPRPSATPASCPAIVCIGAEVHQFMSAGFHTLPLRRDGDVYVGGEVGGYVVLDSTPYFTRCAPRFRCNSEVNEVCGGRECEDPRGPTWKQVQGPRMQEPCTQDPGDCRQGQMGRGYQLRARIPGKGTYAWQMCSSGFVDGDGVPVPGNGCGKVVFRVE